MYINPYTGQKYKKLADAKIKAKRGRDFPPFVTKKKFLEILVRHRR